MHGGSIRDGGKDGERVADKVAVRVMARVAGRVAGKRVLVTGAASGLGLADARRLAEEGAAVLMTDINREQVEHQARAIAAETAARVLSACHDVGSEAQWQAVLALAETQLGGLDVLVNNAGIVVVATPESTTLEQFRQANRVMSEGVFLGCKYAIPLLRAAGGGSIINMSSLASHQGYPAFFAYSAAKGAVRAMTKSVAMHCQLNGDGIRCNSIHAGAIDTPMVAQANRQIGLEAPGDDDPIGLGRPEDVANMVLYLASDESAFVNGAEFVIDNGLLIKP